MASFETDDAEALKSAYANLLGARTAMMDGFSQREQSLYRREIIIDSLISGLLNHLEQVASNKDICHSKLQSFGGGTLPAYANSLVSEVTTLFQQISAASSATPGSPQSSGGSGRQPGRRGR